ncbi:MAG: nucleoside deaminase [Mariprofundus sp.]|nr:nucleoside deaminase [Mariprofundus sp.]
MDIHQDSYPDTSTRMRLAIELSALNIEHQTGGPFGAIVFDRTTFQFISAGVNRVMACAASIAHAEIMAITAAQQQLGSFDLSARGLPSCELVSSCEPCAMCFGAVPWSGVRHLVCAARDSDARAIGFDEGPKLSNWKDALLQRGITVETDICRSDAVGILRHYAGDNGLIYNAGHDLKTD